VDNSQTLAKFHLNLDNNEIDDDYEPQLLEAFLELDAVKVIVKMDEDDLDRQLDWVDREEEEPLSRNIIK